MKKKKQETDALPMCYETQATIVLGIKVHNIMEFHLTLFFYAFQLHGIKMVKIDFSNNQIGEIEKRMTFQGVFIHK